MVDMFRRALRRFRWTGAALLLACGGVGPLAASSVAVVQVRFGGGSSAAGQGPVDVVATPISMPAGVALEPVSGRIDAPGVVHLALPADGVWRVEARGDGLWSTVAQVSSREPRPEAAIELFAAGFLRLELAPPPGTALPDRVPVRLSSPPGRRALLPPSLVLCPLDGKILSCALPGLDLDLVVKVPGHAGAFLWDVALRPAATLALGPIELVAGSSVVGFAASTDGRPLPSDTTVRLQPDAVRAPGPPPSPAELARVPTTKPGARGFFQFRGLAPGSYRVVAIAPGRGEAEAGGLSLPPGAELELRAPLVLVPPAEVEVTVTPARSLAGEPWTIELSREELPGRWRRTEHQPVSRDGRLRFRQLRAGSYSVRVADPVGTPVAWKLFELPGAERVDLTVELVEVEGRITLGDEPLAADLWFGWRTGVPRAQILAGEDGAFSGFLPRSGRWRLEVSTPDGAISRRLASVLVDPPLAGGPARLDVRLPDTRLAGRVIDEQGRPAPGAVVAVNVPAEATAFPLRTDERGRFAARGLAVGEILLSAEGWVPGVGEAEAAPMPVEVRESGSVPASVELTLRGKRTLRGRVVGLYSEPAAGALVEAVALAGPRMAGVSMASTLSGLDGRFSLALPGQADRAIVYFGASGGGLRARSVDLGTESDLTLVSEAPGGELVVRLGAPLDFDDPGAGIPFLFQDGLPIPPGVFLGWARAQGSPAGSATELRIPRLAPGAYAVCLVEPSERQRIEVAPGLFAPGPRCHRTHLPAGGQAEVEL